MLQIMNFLVRKGFCLLFAVLNAVVAGATRQLSQFGFFFCVFLGQAP